MTPPEDSSELSEMAEGGSATRRGRFRVTAPDNSGPPETTVGRFRLNPQSGKNFIKKFKI